MGLISQKFNGILHFLVQSKIEAGCLDVIELAPSVFVRNSEITPHQNFMSFLMHMQIK